MNNYSYRYQKKLDNKFIEVEKNTIKTCNGLILSLKVMDTFLEEQKGWDIGSEFYKDWKEKRFGCR